jgi:hydrogenase maturation protease
MSGKVLVAGIGNIFLGDDAFGVEVVNRLSQKSLPGNVCVVDFGIRSFDLAYALMDDWDLVILVDATPQGGDPGTVYTIEPELPVDIDSTDSFDAHTMNPVSVLRLVTALGGKVGRMLVVGCEPETLAEDEAGSIGLSARVRAGVDEAVRVIQELVASEQRTAA